MGSGRSSVGSGKSSSSTLLRSDGEVHEYIEELDGDRDVSDIVVDGRHAPIRQRDELCDWPSRVPPQKWPFERSAKESYLGPLFSENTLQKLTKDD